MQENRFLELTAKFLSKEINTEEQNELSILLQLDNYKKQFETIVLNWNSEKRDTPEFKLEEGIEILEDKLYSKDKRFEWSENTKENIQWYQKRTLLKIAASFIFFALLSTVALYFSGILSTQKELLALEERTTRNGEKSILKLSDGTTITLNGGSKIKYPKKFEGNLREVFLEGEAYFEVQHDSARRFIVRTGMISTTVLGTKFNIASFPGEKNTVVSLVEGSVKISKENLKEKVDIALLQPKQQLSYDRKEEIGIFSEFDLQEAVGWKDNLLVFKKELFSDVIVKLERNYGIKMEVANKSFLSKKITANFQNASFWTVTETLKKLTGLKYKSLKENNRIIKVIFY